MELSKSVKVVLIVAGLILLAIGGMSIWHFSEATPPLNNKQATSGNDFTNLAIRVGSATTPSANTLQPLTPSVGNTAASNGGAANPQQAATVDSMHTTGSRTDSTPQSGNVTSSPTQFQPVRTLTDDLQGTVGGVVGGVSGALGL